MSLTLGTGVFGPKSHGRFNFEPADQALYWEDFPKRVRAELGGQTVADSRRVKALFETGRMMVFYFPKEDVRMDMLQATDRETHCPLKGDASYWTIRAGDRSAQNAAWTYEKPIDSAAFLSGHLAFEYEAMDAWYHELDRSTPIRVTLTTGSTSTTPIAPWRSVTGRQSSLGRGPRGSCSKLVSRRASTFLRQQSVRNF